MNQNRMKRAREKRFSLLLARLATIFATPFNPFGYNDKFYLVFFPVFQNWSCDEIGSEKKIIAGCVSLKKSTDPDWLNMQMKWLNLTNCNTHITNNTKTATAQFRVCSLEGIFVFWFFLSVTVLIFRILFLFLFCIYLMSCAVQSLVYLMCVFLLSWYRFYHVVSGAHHAFWCISLLQNDCVYIGWSWAAPSIGNSIKKIRRCMYIMNGPKRQIKINTWNNVVYCPTNGFTCGPEREWAWYRRDREKGTRNAYNRAVVGFTQTPMDSAHTHKLISTDTTKLRNCPKNDAKAISIRYMWKTSPTRYPYTMKWPNTNRIHTIPKQQQQQKS